MTALDAAITTAFTGNPTLVAAFPGGFHSDIAPETTTVFPYLTYKVLSGAVETMYGNKKRAKVYVRFQAVGPGKPSVSAMMDTFTGVFDDTVLTLTTGTNYDCRRTQEPIPFMFSRRTNTGDEIWSWTVEYVYETRN